MPQDKKWLEKMIETLRERAKTLTELVDSASYYLTDEITIEENTAKKFFTKDIAAPIEALSQKFPR